MNLLCVLVVVVVVVVVVVAVLVVVVVVVVVVVAVVFLALILHFRYTLLQICALGLRFIGFVPESYVSCPEATN